MDGHRIRQPGCCSLGSTENIQRNRETDRNKKTATASQHRRNEIQSPAASVVVVHRTAVAAR